MQTNWLRFFERAYFHVHKLFTGLFSEIFFMSDFLRESKAFDYIDEKKKQLIFNYIPAAPEMNEVSRKENTILHLGRLSEEKGIDLLLQMVVEVRKKVPSIKVNIVGDGTEKYTAYLHALTQKLGLSDVVTFHGKLTGLKKNEAYYSNSLLVLPARYHGLSNVCLEGIIHHIPIFVSSKWTLPKALIQEECILDVTNISESSEKIVDFFTNDEVRSKITLDKEKIASFFTDELRLGRQLVAEYQKFV